MKQPPNNPMQTAGASSRPLISQTVDWAEGLQGCPWIS